MSCKPRSKADCAAQPRYIGCEFRLASPRLSLVKVMRITGLDRRFLASQAPVRLVRA